MKPRRCRRKVTHRPPNAASTRGLQQALLTLYSPLPPTFDAFDERERIRIEDEARRTRQGALPLKPAP